jgi:hypothetical protein
MYYLIFIFEHFAYFFLIFVSKGREKQCDQLSLLLLLFGHVKKI